MIDFENKYFKKFKFSKNRVEKFLSSSLKDLKIAEASNVPEVKFQFAYNSLIKLGISLIACSNYKVSSRMGHHRKILEKTSEILMNEDILLYGNQMRKIRNTELYDSGVIITDKQAKEFLCFAQKVQKLSQVFFKKYFRTLL